MTVFSSKFRYVLIFSSVFSESFELREITYYVLHVMALKQLSLTVNCVMLKGRVKRFDECAM